MYFQYAAITGVNLDLLLGQYTSKLLSTVMDFLCKALTLTLAVFIKAESCEGETKYMHDIFSSLIINQTSVHVIFYSWSISTMGENHIRPTKLNSSH